jgi:hypothetical protein
MADNRADRVRRNRHEQLIYTARSIAVGYGRFGLSEALAALADDIAESRAEFNADTVIHTPPPPVGPVDPDRLDRLEDHAYDDVWASQNPLAYGFGYLQAATGKYDTVAEIRAVNRGVERAYQEAHAASLAGSQARIDAAKNPAAVAE